MINDQAAMSASRESKEALRKLLRRWRAKVAVEREDFAAQCGNFPIVKST
jgi:hypothetical protein